MQLIKTTDYYEDLEFSRDDNHFQCAAKILQEQFPDAIRIEKSAESHDINGVDVWLHRKYGRSLCVDIKFRRSDPITFKPVSINDLALETVSRVDTGKIGWAMDPTKLTDFVLWYFAPTRRGSLWPYHSLRTVTIANYERWKKRYGEQTLETERSRGGSYASKFIFVPAKVIHQATTRLNNRACVCSN